MTVVIIWQKGDNPIIEVKLFSTEERAENWIARRKRELIHEYERVYFWVKTLHVL